MYYCMRSSDGRIGVFRSRKNAEANGKLLPAAEARRFMEMDVERCNWARQNRWQRQCDIRGLYIGKGRNPLSLAQRLRKYKADAVRQATYSLSRSRNETLRWAAGEVLAMYIGRVQRPRRSLIPQSCVRPR